MTYTSQCRAGMHSHVLGAASPSCKPQGIRNRAAALGSQPCRVFQPRPATLAAASGRSSSRHPRLLPLAASQVATNTELENNKKRWEESGNKKGSVDDWRWTLNWNEVTPNIVIGSCPRSPDDLDKLVQGSGATAVLCLQSDACLEAMGIDWGVIRERGVKRDVLMVRVAIRDFDHFDQTVMLPEAVKVVAALLAMGKRVYIHCTAGINRASLVTVGYLTFFQGASLQDATKLVKSKRPQAHPYIDCWKSARARALEGCTDAVARRAKQLWHRRRDAGKSEDGLADWVAAEDYVVRQLFQRQLSCSLSLVSSIKDLQEGSMVGLACMPKQELELRQQEGEVRAAELTRVRSQVVEERRRLREALAELSIARREIEDLRHGVCSVDYAPDEGLALELQDAQKSLEATKEAMRQIYLRSQAALAGTMSMDSMDDG